MILCCQKPPKITPRSGTQRPPRPVPKFVNRKIIKNEIQHAKLICKNYEDSFECKAAWEYVQDLEDRLNAVEDAVRYMELDEWTPHPEIKDREYDL
jgi:hypothetical protein